MSPALRFSLARAFRLRRCRYKIDAGADLFPRAAPRPVAARLPVPHRALRWRCLRARRASRAWRRSGS